MIQLLHTHTHTHTHTHIYTIHFLYICDSVTIYIYIYIYKIHFMYEKDHVCMFGCQTVLRMSMTFLTPRLSQGTLPPFLSLPFLFYSTLNGQTHTHSHTYTYVPLIDDEFLITFSYLTFRSFRASNILSHF